MCARDADPEARDLGAAGSTWNTDNHASTGAATQGRQQTATYFWLLSEQERLQAIRRLAASGMTDHTIASLTALDVEMVRRVLAASVVRE